MNPLTTKFEGEARLLAQALVATVRQPLLILDSSFRVLTANKGFYDMFRISNSETEGCVLFDLGNGQWNIPLLRKLLEHILPDQSEVNGFEVNHSFPIIGERVMILNARTLVQRPNEPPLIFLAIEDATKRIAKTHELELSRDFAEGVIETLRDPLLILDVELNVLSANAAFYKSFPYAAEETEGRKLYDLNNRDWNIPALSTLLENTVLKNSSFRDFELDHVFPGLGHRILLLNGRRVYEKGERTDKILLVMEDITERRRQESSIRFQADALNRVNDAVIAIDKAGGLTYWNSRAERLLSIPSKSSEGIQLANICTHLEGESPGALFEISSEEQPWREYRVRLKDSDDEYYLESSATTNFEKNGKPAGSLVVLRDVTVKKKAEIRLKRMNEELDLFTSIASHDLQEPLRMVSMYMGLMAKAYQGKLGPDADTYIGFAVDGTKRMKALIDDLLKYARFEAGGEKLRRVALNRIVKEVLHDLQVSIKEMHATVQVPDLPEVISDEAQMRQVFQNLIGNAIKYRSQERAPIVTVATEKTPTEWVISVRDNGTGFDMAFADRIFKMFQRLETKTSVS